MEENRKMHCCPHEGCNATFSRPYRVSDHLFSVHTNVRTYVCEEEGCSKSYSNKSHLIRHVNTAHKHLDNYTLHGCPTCLKTFTNRQNLKRHIKVQHLMKMDLTCDICKLNFKKKNLLKAHMYEHDGIKSFFCEICDKSFITLYEKKRHMRCHKTYDCVECQLKFDVWSKYQKHRKLVHEVKEYICNECSRRFKQRSYMVRHVKTHDTNCFFKCPYDNCERFYSRTNNLKQHVLIRHAKLSFECTICKAQLTTEASLNSHIIKRHKESKKVKPKPKTIATGRKDRKDKGVGKVTTAQKLAGLPTITDEAIKNITNPET